MRINFLFLLLAILLIGCSTSNKISNSWKNPDATEESIKFQTVAVFGMVKDQQMRKDVEEAIAGQMVNTIAVPSYKMITNEELADLDAVKKKLSERGMEGALVLSVRNVIKEPVTILPECILLLIIPLEDIIIMLGIICTIPSFIQALMFT